MAELKNKKTQKPKKTRQLQVYDEERPAAVNEYYIKFSSRFKAAKFASVIILAVFLILMLGKYRSSITYDNFKYLIRDLDTSYSAGGGGSFSSIRYDAQSNMRFSLFKNELAVVGSSRVSLYSSSGAQTLSEVTISAKPILEVSDKYILLYDLGSYNLTLYNSFTKVLEKTYDSPIFGAEICDSGAFAVITRSLEAKYEILFCNGSFTPVAKYYKNKYVIDVAIRSDGGEIAILSTDSVGGNFSSELMVCQANSKEAKYTYTIDNSYPIAVKYLDGGKLFVMFDNKMIFYDADGVKVNQYDISGKQPVCMNTNGNRVAAVIGTSIVNSENNIMVFDTDGNILYNDFINIKVKDISVTNDRLYILSTSTAIRVSDYQNGLAASHKDEVSVPGSSLRIIGVSDDGREAKKCALICTDTAAYNIFDEIESEKVETETDF